MRQQSDVRESKQCYEAVSISLRWLHSWLVRGILLADGDFGVTHPPGVPGSDV